MIVNAVEYEGRSNREYTRYFKRNKSQSKDTNSRRESNASITIMLTQNQKNLDNDDKATLLKKQ
jgi:hypothetical protein